MKTMNKIFITLAACTSLTAQAADTYLGNAQSLNWSISALYLWSDPLCTGTPITVFDGSPITSDFLASPTLATASINFSGEFHCVGVRMSSIMTAVPSFTSGPCTAGTPVELNLFSPSSCGACTSQNADGSAGPAPSNSAQSVTMYFSTASTSGNPSQMFMKPTSAVDGVHGTKLASPFVVSGSRVGTFITKNLQYMGYYNATSGQCDVISGAAGTPDPFFSFE